MHDDIVAFIRRDIPFQDVAIPGVRLDCIHPTLTPSEATANHGEPADIRPDIDKHRPRHDELTQHREDMRVEHLAASDRVRYPEIGADVEHQFEAADPRYKDIRRRVPHPPPIGEQRYRKEAQPGGVPEPSEAGVIGTSSAVRAL